MKASLLPLVTLLLLPHALRAEEKADGFQLPAPPQAMMEDEAAYADFARSARDRVEELLADPARLDDPAALRRLLALPVHLAHHFADDERAACTAAWIRTLQTDPAERAFAGLSSFAAVAARQEHPGRAPGDADFRRAFRDHFARQLAALPRTPEMLAVLRRQRERVAALHRDSVLHELRESFPDPEPERRQCSLAEADAVARAFHRLHRLLPLREETMTALDAAIAARARP